MRCASISATDHASACSRMRGASSPRRSATSFLESSKPTIRRFGFRITAAATPGPNTAPRPASSRPAMRVQPSLRAARSKRVQQRRLMMDGPILARSGHSTERKRAAALSETLLNLSLMTVNLKSVIVGTAGHIDHGKSSLVQALTGTDPDRLAEEKRRGITIDLGFAFLEDDGIRFGFIDVPGHERFVSNMLAGAAGIDLMLLVIAADESIKPQTREHFDICKLLGVKHGVVALTKSDLVDDSGLTLAQLEIEEYVRGSFLEGSAIVPVSAKTGAGIPELKRALHDAAMQVGGKDAPRSFPLPIDRAFAMKGFGTVVTGTLISGAVGTGDEVEMLPGGERLRVRGVQTGGQAVARAFAGQRTAVNLAGIDHIAVRRGMTLAEPGKFRRTRRIDAQFTLLAGTHKLKHRERVHFHASTAETIAEILLYGASELAPGQTVLAHLVLQDAMVMGRTSG